MAGLWVSVFNRFNPRPCVRGDIATAGGKQLKIVSIHAPV